MRKLALSLIVAFAFYVTAAAAQAGGGMGGAQGTQGQSPSSQQPNGPGASPGAQPGTPGPDMGPNTSDQNGTAGNTANTNSNKGEKKLKGCVESQGSQYVLETKKGPVSLTGQDVSAHVGHEITVKGMWENGGSNSSATATSSGTESMSKGTFNVTDVKMDSETCKIKSKDNMGTSGNSGMSGSSSGSSTGAGSSTGNSTGTSGTGTGNSGSGTGSSTTPPQ